MVNATALGAALPSLPGVSEFHSCGDPGSMALLALLCVVGLVLAFAGYRLYTSCLGVFGFLLAFAAEAAAGAHWIASSEGAETEKKVVAAIFCLLWGLMGAIICLKLYTRLERFLGFLLGASLGAGLVGGLVYGLRESVNEHLPPAYAGWESFAVLTLGLPAALAAGALARNCIMRLLMLTSALGGAAMAVHSLTSLLACAKVDLGEAVHPGIESIIVIVLAALGFGIQLYLGRPAGAAEGSASKPAMDAATAAV